MASKDARPTTEAEAAAAEQLRRSMGCQGSVKGQAMLKRRWLVRQSCRQGNTTGTVQHSTAALHRMPSSRCLCILKHKRALTYGPVLLAAQICSLLDKPLRSDPWLLAVGSWTGSRV